MNATQTTVTDAYGRVHTVPGPYRLVSEMRLANKRAGQHWFEPATMRYFRSRVAPAVTAGRFFISSEQFVPFDGEPEPRRYTVRLLDDAGHVHDLSEFQQFDTLRQARAWLARRLDDAV